MAIIQRDCIGLLVFAGGYVCRLMGETKSKFKVGDNVKVYHFGGSCCVGVGKTKGKRGKYEEHWSTAGLSVDEYKKQPKETLKQFLYHTYNNPISLYCYDDVIKNCAK